MLNKLFVISVIIASIAINGGLSLRSDGSEFAHERVSGSLEVIDCMAISTRAIVVLAAASQMAARHAQPQVRTQVALSAMRK